MVCLSHLYAHEKRAVRTVTSTASCQRRPCLNAERANRCIPNQNYRRRDEHSIALDRPPFRLRRVTQTPGLTGAWVTTKRLGSRRLGRATLFLRVLAATEILLGALYLVLGCRGVVFGLVLERLVAVGL